MDPEEEVIKDGAVLIQDNKIADVGDKNTIQSKYNPDEVIDAKDKIVIPGLVDLHFHSSNMSRGKSENLGLKEFLESYYYPVIEASDSEDVYYEALLAYSEALLTGTTVVNDMYHDLESCARAAEDIGIKAILSSTTADLVDGLESLEDNEDSFNNIESPSGRVEVWFGVEWLPLCSDEHLEKARKLADEYDTGIHIHLNESQNEVETCVEEFGERPTVRAYNCDVLGPDTVAAHCVWLTDEEKSMYAETGAHISHNPTSNAKLGNGIAPAPELLELDINVGVGIDAAICNNTSDLFETMKDASLYHKAKEMDASQMPAKKILEMATINGAKALGMEDEIGSIEPGKKADLVLIDLNMANMRPIHFGERHNIYTNLVYSSPGNAVDTVLVNGKTIVEDKQLATMELNEIIESHSNRTEDIMEKRKQYLS